MNKFSGESMNLTNNNIKELKSIFPEVFIDGKIDFEKLKLILGEDIESSDEKYQLMWKGKNEAVKISQTPSMGTLRPDKESSKNWDTTENLYIEGDNLEVLKLLQKSYFGKIKMIYIDPPYNTGKEFVYKDNFKDNIGNYKEITSQKNKANVETNGRYHTDWLNMMYPRLKLARNLLREDGVIFISIDNNEVSNLKKICDEIFGEENFIEKLIWKKKQGGGNDSKYFVSEHEYLLCYGKSIKCIKLNIDSKHELDEKLYPFEDVYGKYGLVTLDKSSIRFSESLVFDIIGPDGKIYYPRIVKGKQSCWRWGKEKVKKEYNNLVFKNGNVYTKYYKPAGVIPRSLLVDSRFGRTEVGKEEATKLLGKIEFSYPKPTSLIEHILRVSTANNDIILDFFAGSSTTAHSVMKLNVENNSNRKFIMVQLPEKTDEKSETYKAGYKNICEIGKERIRRAGEQIISETGKSDLDIGFKVFKLDDSNIKTWNSSYENLETTLFDMIDNIKEDRTQEDLLYEILLKLGYPLTSKIEEININDKTIFNIENSLLVCLESEIDSSIIEIISQINIKDKDTLKVVFKDSGFKLDKDKMNVVENLRQCGILDVRSV